MVLVIAVLGVVIAALCVYGAVRPRALIDLVASIPSERRIPIMASARAAMGVVLIAAAGDTGWPRTVAAIGVVALVAAVGLVLLGRERVDAMIGWWTEASTTVIRAWLLLGLAFGAFLAMAALQGGGGG